MFIKCNIEIKLKSKIQLSSNTLHCLPNIGLKIVRNIIIDYLFSERALTTVQASEEGARALTTVQSCCLKIGSM